jgi:hypothetical protein
MDYLEGRLPEYDFEFNNCVTETRWEGQAVGITLPEKNFPETLGHALLDSPYRVVDP